MTRPAESKLDEKGLEAASVVLYELGRGQAWPGVIEHEGNAPTPVKHVGVKTAAETAIRAYLAAVSEGQDEVDVRAPNEPFRTSEDEGLVEKMAEAIWGEGSPPYGWPRVTDKEAVRRRARAALAAVREHQGREGLTKEEREAIVKALQAAGVTPVPGSALERAGRKLSEGGTDG